MTLYLKTNATTIQERNEIRNYFVVQQGGRCAICEVVFTERIRPALDHCHETDHCRGALCTNCNHGLGLFKDNPDFLERAAEYVTEYHLNNPLYPGSEEYEAQQLLDDLEEAEEASCGG